MSEEILQKIRKVAQADLRYKLDAYVFIFQSLDHTVENVTKERRHLSGQELLEGARRLAIEQFGPMAQLVWNSWGVYRTEDWGEIVWNLVQSGLMGKTDTDSKDDFNHGYDFAEAFSLDNTVRLASGDDSR